MRHPPPRISPSFLSKRTVAGSAPGPPGSSRHRRETAHTLVGQPPVGLDFARIWRAADKIVYSTTLQTPDTARTRIERDFDPVQVRKLKEAADHDLTVGGARLAAQAIAAGLVDEYQLFVVPAIVGGGTRALPDQVRLNLALAEEHRFGSGTVYLCYRPA